MAPLNLLLSMQNQSPVDRSLQKETLEPWTGDFMCTGHPKREDMWQKFQLVASHFEVTFATNVLQASLILEGLGLSRSTWCELVTG